MSLSFSSVFATPPGSNSNIVGQNAIRVPVTFIRSVRFALLDDVVFICCYYLGSQFVSYRFITFKQDTDLQQVVDALVFHCIIELSVLTRAILKCGSYACGYE